MKKLALLVVLAAAALALSGGGFFDNWGVESAQAGTPIQSVIDPGGGGNSPCWSALSGAVAYFQDWNWRMHGYFLCTGFQAWTSYTQDYKGAAYGTVVGCYNSPSFPWPYHFYAWIPIPGSGYCVDT